MTLVLALLGKALSWVSTRAWVAWVVALGLLVLLGLQCRAGAANAAALEAEAARDRAQFTSELEAAALEYHELANRLDELGHQGEKPVEVATVEGAPVVVGGAPVECPAAPPPAPVVAPAPAPPPAPLCVLRRADTAHVRAGAAILRNQAGALRLVMQVDAIRDTPTPAKLWTEVLEAPVLTPDLATPAAEAAVDLTPRISGRVAVEWGLPRLVPTAVVPGLDVRVFRTPWWVTGGIRLGEGVIVPQVGVRYDWSF